MEGKIDRQKLLTWQAVKSGLSNYFGIAWFRWYVYISHKASFHVVLAGDDFMHLSLQFYHNKRKEDGGRHAIAAQATRTVLVLLLLV